MSQKTKKTKKEVQNKEDNQDFFYYNSDKDVDEVLDCLQPRRSLKGRLSEEVFED
jgi:hypothetical protein